MTVVGRNVTVVGRNVTVVGRNVTVVIYIYHLINSMILMDGLCMIIGVMIIQAIPGLNRGNLTSLVAAA